VFVYLLLVLVLRVPWIVVSPQVGTKWWRPVDRCDGGNRMGPLFKACGRLDRRHFGFVTGDTGLRPIARMLFGSGLDPFGLAHLLYMDATAPLVPDWLLWPVFWSYFTRWRLYRAAWAYFSVMFARLAPLL